MQRLTVAEYARRTGKNESTVRKWINTGQLKTSTEVINNRKVTVILVEDSFESVQDDTGSVLPDRTGMIQDHQKSSPEPLYGDFVQKMYEDNMNLVQDIKNYADSIKEYAEKAGQAKLLTVSEEKTKEQFFQTQQENKSLVTENASLKKEVDLLKDQLKDLKVELTSLREQNQQAIQIEAESKIKDMTIRELEEKLNEINKAFEELKNAQQEKTSELTVGKHADTDKSWLSKL